MSETNYPDTVMQQQEAIRKSGMTNMFDISTVQEIAEEMGLDNLVEFIDNHSTEEYFDMAEKAAEKYR